MTISSGGANPPLPRIPLAVGRVVNAGDTSAKLRAYVQAQNTRAHVKGARLFALLTWAILLFICVYVYSQFLDGSLEMLLATLFTYMAIVCSTLPAFIVYQAPFEGALLDNMFTATLYAVGRGLTFKYPWLRKSKERVVALEVMTKSFEESFSSKDNVRLYVKATIQLMPLLSHLQKFWEIEDDAIIKGAIGSLRKCMTEVIAQYTADKIRKQPSTVERETIEKYMQSGDIHLSFEEMYGTGLYDLEVCDIDRSQKLAGEYEEIAFAQVLVKAAKKLADRSHLFKMSNPEFKGLFYAQLASLAKEGHDPKNAETLNLAEGQAVVEMTKNLPPQDQGRMQELIAALSKRINYNVDNFRVSGEGTSVAGAILAKVANNLPALTQDKKSQGKKQKGKQSPPAKKE